MINSNNHFTYFSFFIDVISEKNLVLFVNLRFDWQRYSKNKQPSYTYARNSANKVRPPSKSDESLNS